MSDYIFANNVLTTLNASLTSGATSLTLTSTANLPTIPAGAVWPLTLNDIATRQNFEIVYVTAITGAVCTVLRGQEGTTAQSWNAGDLAYGPGVTAGVLQNLQQTSQPYVGNPLSWVNFEGTTTDNFSTLTQLNATPYTIPANSLTQGQVIRLKLSGLYSCTSTPTLSFQFKIGGQSLGASGNITAQGSNQEFETEYMAVCSATGSSGALTFIYGGYSWRSNSVAQALIIIGNGITINTTIANQISFYGQYSVASVSNLVTLQGWTVETMTPGAIVT